LMSLAVCKQNFYLWTQKFEFPVISICHKLVLFFVFSNRQNIETILALQGVLVSNQCLLHLSQQPSVHSSGLCSGSLYILVVLIAVVR
jgi:hypothetical protein